MKFTLYCEQTSYLKDVQKCFCFKKFCTQRFYFIPKKKIAISLVLKCGSTKGLRVIYFPDMTPVSI